MNLSAILESMRIELSDTATFWGDQELTRAVEKTVSLMSRLIPKRSIVEDTIVREITSTDLVVGSGTGTLDYKPVKVGSVVITGKTLDTDYRINYLTGVVTPIGENLPNATYTVAYDLDPNMFDLSTLLTTEFIKIERIECPAGDSPRTNITFDHVGSFLIFKDAVLSEDKHIRITYLEPWVAPGASDGDYPKHLENAVIIGGCGQALIFKAEKYVQEAVDALATISAPDLHVYLEISAPDLPTGEDIPSAPTVPTLTFVEPEYCLAKVTGDSPEAGVLIDALALLTTGITFANAITDGERVTEKYGEYARTKIEAANAYVTRAIGSLRIQEDNITKYASQVASYGSDVNKYANTISGTVGKYREQIEGQRVAVASSNALIAKYAAQAGEQEMKARNLLSIAGRYLASGQAKINEMLAMLGLKPEFHTSKAHSEQRD